MAGIKTCPTKRIQDYHGYGQERGSDSNLGHRLSLESKAGYSCFYDDSSPTVGGEWPALTISLLFLGPMWKVARDTVCTICSNGSVNSFPLLVTNYPRRN